MAYFVTRAISLIFFVTLMHSVHGNKFDACKWKRDCRACVSSKTCGFISSNGKEICVLKTQLLSQKVDRIFRSLGECSKYMNLSALDPTRHTATSSVPYTVHRPKSTPPTSPMPKLQALVTTHTPISTSQRSFFLPKLSLVTTEKTHVYLTQLPVSPSQTSLAKKIPEVLMTSISSSSRTPAFTSISFSATPSTSTSIKAIFNSSHSFTSPASHAINPIIPKLDSNSEADLNQHSHDMNDDRYALIYAAHRFSRENGKPEKLFYMTMPINFSCDAMELKGRKDWKSWAKAEFYLCRAQECLTKLALAHQQPEEVLSWNKKNPSSPFQTSLCIFLKWFKRHCGGRF